LVDSTGHVKPTINERLEVVSAKERVLPNLVGQDIAFTVKASESKGQKPIV
jgi:hypothetical protein